MTSVEDEKQYWDTAAADPEVDVKYISDISDQDCIDAILSDIKPGRVLEIGCGVGRLLSKIEEQSKEYNLYGLDISEKMMRIARDRNPDSKTMYVTGDGRTLPFKNVKFDSVYSVLVFQHIPPAGVRSYFKEVYRVLEPGGVFRFQFVAGDYHGPIDHNYRAGGVDTELRKVGFTKVVFTPGLVHDQWCWVTCVKPEQ